MGKLLVNGEVVPVKAGESLLEAAEDAGFTPEYQCRNGFCGACRAKLAGGSVSYRNDPLAYCGEDEVLLCCASLKADEDATIELVRELEPHHD